MVEKMLDKLVIIAGDNREILTSVLPDTFQVQRTVNQNWSLSFTAYNDGSIPFSLLNPQSTVSWKGQEYTIKQSQPNFQQGTDTIQVQATHVGYDVSRIVQHNVNEGTKTYSVNDVLSFYLSGNEFGYTWEVDGDFPTQQIENLGGGTGQDMLSKIFSTWDNAVFNPDNKNIRICSSDNFYFNEGKVVTYRGNASSVQITYDSTGLTNKVYCESTQKSDTSDNSNPQYWFEPFYVQNDDSVKQYGVIEHAPISDDRFHDADSMRQYALSQLQPQPTISIQCNYINQIEEEIKVGQLRQVIIPEMNLNTLCKVTQANTYPLSANQASTAQLDSTANTILNYNHSLQTGMALAQENNTKIASFIGDAISNNKEQINAINDALKNSTSDLTLNTSYGAVQLHRVNSIVYVSVNLSNVLYDNAVTTLPSEYRPSNDITDNFTISSDNTNYIVNYTIKNTGEFNITGIADFTGKQVQLDSFSGQFNYMK